MIRPWRVADAEALARAVAESLEHLRPWMPWIAEEPRPIEQRREMIARWARDFEPAGDRVYGIFAGDAVVGACGLHRRLGPEALEIGYWVHAGHVRRGIATAAAAAMTDEAFAIEGIEHVEIHHDVANVASEGVPRGLGFQPAGHAFAQHNPPAGAGMQRVWVMTRERWAHRCPGSAGRRLVD